MTAGGHAETPVTGLACQTFTNDNMRAGGIRPIHHRIHRPENGNGPDPTSGRDMQRPAVIDHGQTAVLEQSRHLAEGGLPGGIMHSIAGMTDNVRAQIFFFRISFTAPVMPISSPKVPTRTNGNRQVGFFSSDAALSLQRKSSFEEAAPKP